MVTASTTWKGCRQATFNDLDQGRDYMVKRRKHTANAKLQLPFFPNLVAEANYVLEEKNGWKSGHPHDRAVYPLPCRISRAAH